MTVTGAEGRGTPVPPLACVVALVVGVGLSLPTELQPATERTAATRAAPNTLASFTITPLVRPILYRNVSLL